MTIFTPGLTRSIIILFIIIICSSLLRGQEKITLNYADSLIGKTINGEQVREAIGNVSMTHNEVKIFCNHVIQYFDQNKADLSGNVKVIKDTMTITAPSGTYYGNESKVICSNGATLNDSKNILTADYGIYYFDKDLASFKGHVRLYDNKSYTLTSDALDYYRSVNKSYAEGNVKIVSDSATIYSDKMIYEKLIGISTGTGNVKIESDSTVIYSDTLTYFEFDKKSIARNNVKINFTNKNAWVYGSYAENYERTNYSFVKGNAELVQTEKKEDKTDTMFIFSDKMESFRNRPEHYIAKDSVRVIRSDFLSSSQLGYYYKDTVGTGGLVILSANPAVWKDNFQVTGDSIYSFFKENIEKILVYKSAFAIETNLTYPDRYDQISGVFMFMSFQKNQLDYIEVDTNASSIYFAYDEGKPNGVNRTTGRKIIMYFKDRQVVKVRVVDKPVGKYIPENLINLSELRLLGFRIRKDKPVRLQ